MHKSHILQNLLNFFDPKDVRMREQSNTIDAQLLNLAASTRESTDMRVQREASVRNIQTIPLNVDNGGVYTSARIPQSIIVDSSSVELGTVVGTRNASPINVTLLDDTLPVPTSVIQDNTRAPVAVSNPVILDITGVSDSGKYPLTQLSGPIVLPIPNKLTFWLEGMGLNTGFIEIVIEGEVFPRPVWTAQRTTTTEAISIASDGLATSKFRWEIVNNVTVWGLASGARLRAWCLTFNMPAEPDVARPYTDSHYRDQEFGRYWQIQQPLLMEMYIRGLDTGLETYQTYMADLGLVDVAIEPCTNGMLLATSSSLLYIDRREPFPDNLGTTALTIQPVYGISAFTDTSTLPSQRWVILRPVRYVGIDVYKYRWKIQTPTGALYSLTNSGAFTPYEAWAGWRTGDPQTMRLPLLEVGTYTFTLECQDATSAIIKDSVPYGNFGVLPLATMPINWVTEVKGVCYDSFGQAWIWTGTSAVPIKFIYDAYLFDPIHRTIFLTDTYDYIEVDN